MRLPVPESWQAIGQTLQSSSRWQNLMRPSKPRILTAIIILNGVSTFGSGLIYPYTTLYLTGTPAFGASGVSLYYATSAIANLAISLVFAAGWVRPPPAILGAVGTALLAAGYLGISAADSLTLLAASVLVVGCGQACTLAALVPVLNALAPLEQRRETFARRYRGVNIGLSAGALAAGVIVGLFSASVIRWLFVGNAVTYIPLTGAFLATHHHGLAARRRATTTSSDGGRIATPLWRLGAPALFAALFQLYAYMFGYSQFEATAPLIAVRLMRIRLAVVSVLLLVNTAVVVFGQKRVTTLLTRRDEEFGLRIAVLAWIFAYILAAVTAFGPVPLRIAGLVAFAVVFALGECSYSCSFSPWLVSSVAEDEITRVSALANSLMGLGIAAGPTIGVVLVLSGSASAAWTSLAGFCLLMLPCVRRRSRA